MKRDGFDICASYKVLIGEAIPKLAGGDKILEQSMMVSVTRLVRSKYSVDPVPPRKPSTERPPVVPTKEMPAIKGPSSEMPAVEEPSSPKKKSRNGTSKEGVPRHRKGWPKLRPFFLKRSRRKVINFLVLSPFSFFGR